LYKITCYNDEDNATEHAAYEKLLNEAMEDGTETNITIKNYWKFTFTITFTTNNNTWLVEVGGDAQSIFKLDPHGGWDEWQAAGINRLSKLWDYSPPKSK
jgi:hypothetical protein